MTVSWISVSIALYYLVLMAYSIAGKESSPKQNSAEFKKNLILTRAAGYARHNELRKQHNCVPLKRDEKLEAKAQKYANQLIKLEELKPDQLKLSNDAKKNRVGENLFSVRGKKHRKKGVVNFKSLGEVAVNSWYSETCLYNFDKPKVLWKAGRFTQLIWNSTLHVGMGFSYDPKADQYIIVANYKPRGNTPYKSEFAANVPCPASLSLLDNLCEPESEVKKSTSCGAAVKEDSIDHKNMKNPDQDQISPERPVDDNQKEEERNTVRTNSANGLNRDLIVCIYPECLLIILLNLLVYKFGTETL